MNRVFVVQQPVKRVAGNWQPIFDLSPARDFGKLQFILLRPGNIAPDRLPTVLVHMQETLRDFTDDDYLLPTGEPTAIAAAAMIAGRANGGRVKFLRWDRHSQSYEVVQINI